jgi:hypothetical protein
MINFLINRTQMKSTISFLLLLLSFIAAHGQDIIKTKSGTVLRGKVMSVTSTAITYKTDSADSAAVTLNTSELASIYYANGSKEVFENADTATSGYSTATLMRMGQTDAANRYKEYRSAKTATTIVTAFSPPYGLIPAIACASSRPSSFNLNHMNTELMTNTVYRESYESEAYRIKKRQVWKGFGNGVLIAAAYWTLLFSVLVLTVH